MADKHTFGCGELLPGFGPGSIHEPPPPTITEPPVIIHTPPPVCYSCEEKWTCIQPNPTVAGHCVKGATGQYSTKPQCEQFCTGISVGTPPGGQTAIRWTCILPPAGQFGKGTCIPDKNGKYLTEADCLYDCQKGPGSGGPGGPGLPGGGGGGGGGPSTTGGSGALKWFCYSNGICGTSPNGTFGSEAECLDSAVCNSYNCIILPGQGAGNCVKAGQWGNFSNLAGCLADCTSVTTGGGAGTGPTGGPGTPSTPGGSLNKWTCAAPGNCIPGLTGAYASESECKEAEECNTYNCEGGECKKAGSHGSYSNLGDCQDVCKTKYACKFIGPGGQTTTATCVADENGIYDSPDCDGKCKKVVAGGGDPPPPENATQGPGKMGRGLAGGVAKIANATYITTKSLIKNSLGGAIDSYGVLKTTITDRAQAVGITEKVEGNTTHISINNLKGLITPGELDTVDVDLYTFGRPVQTESSDFVSNTEYLEVLGSRIHRSVAQLINVGNSTRDWNNFLSYELTDDNLLQSLNREFIVDLLALKYASGVPVPIDQSLGIIRTILYSNELGSFNRGTIQQSASFIEESLIVEKSTDSFLNGLAALSILEQKMVTLNHEQNPGRGGEILKNYQPIPYDLAMAVPITVNGVLQHYPVMESGNLLTGEQYHVDDGDVLNVSFPSGIQKVALRSEREHAYVVASEYRELALSLFGESEFKFLEASSNVSSNVEFSYPLNLSGEVPRRDFYVLTAIPSSQNMTFKGDHIVETTGRFGLVADDDTTLSRLNEFYIKHKSNYMAAFVHYDDQIIDHMLAASSVNYTEKDVVFIQGGDKTNPSVPLLVRGYPKYIIIFPTDKSEYQTFSSKSIITSFGPSTVVRKLPLITTVNKRFREKNFIDVELTNEDVYGNPGNQSRKMKLNASGPQFELGYREPTIVHRRGKTGTRIFYEIIQELKNNYVLHNNALIPFDIFSRMTLLEYNKFVFLEGGMEVYNRARDGFFGPRIIEPVRGTIQHNIRTSLKNRLVNAPADVYTPIKSTNIAKEFILPPVSKVTVAKKTPSKPGINQSR